MCRLLAVKSDKEFDINYHLKKFSQIAKNSKEYQGDGWGCAYLKNGEWQIYKNIKPIWEQVHLIDNPEQFGKTTHLIAHARSAFKNHPMKIENNMPFYDGNYVFIFNGELHGVKIKESGNTGAEKIFNYIKRFNGNNILEALKRGTELIKKRAKYIKAMNIIVSDKVCDYVASMFNESPEYFTMYYKYAKNELIICSEKYPGEEADSPDNWQKIGNNTIREFTPQ